MSLDRIGVPRAELSCLASMCDRDVDELAAELHRRPWSLHDLLADPATVRAIREPESIGDMNSPFLLFAVLTRSAADELLEDAFITDDTWQALAARFETEQLIDVIFTVGQYNLVSMALNTLGVQLDDGVKGF